jgi:rod shape-determining protein MreD
MALMAASSREVEVRALPAWVVILVPILALGLQSFLPVHFAPFALLDLPLLVTIYFAIIRSSPIIGTVGGVLIGTLQDALTGLPLGVFGITNSVIGYLAGSIGTWLDTENYGARLLFTFVFSFLHSVMYWLLMRRLLAQPADWSWVREPLRALINAVAGLVLFAILDTTRRSEY